MDCILSMSRMLLSCAHPRNAQLTIVTLLELHTQGVQQYCQKQAVQHYEQTWADLDIYVVNLGSLLEFSLRPTPEGSHSVVGLPVTIPKH